MRFVLDCCGVAGSGEGMRNAAPTGLDLGLIAAATRRHGIAPLIAPHLSLIADQARDDVAIRAIRSNANANALRNKYLVEQLATVLNAFARRNIEALVIKGPALAEVAYGAIGLRSFGDLDIVIRPDDVPQAAGALAGLGFGSALYDEAVFRSRWFDAVEANFQRADDRLNLDLHWALAPRAFAFGPSGEALWQRSIGIEVDGVKVRTLSHEDHLLYIAVHHTRHGWDALSQVCDIAFLIKRVPLDWDVLLERASTTRCARMLAVALWLAHDLLDAPIPPAALAPARRDDRAVRIAAQLGDELTRDDEPGGGRQRALRRALRLVESPIDRVRVIVISAFIPTLMDRRWLRLPRGFDWAYYLLRPIRIALALARTAGRQA